MKNRPCAPHSSSYLLRRYLPISQNTWHRINMKCKAGKRISMANANRNIFLWKHGQNKKLIHLLFFDQRPLQSRHREAELRSKNNHFSTYNKPRELRKQGTEITLSIHICIHHVMSSHSPPGCLYSTF